MLNKVKLYLTHTLHYWKSYYRWQHCTCGISLRVARFHINNKKRYVLPRHIADSYVVSPCQMSCLLPHSSHIHCYISCLYSEFLCIAATYYIYACACIKYHIRFFTANIPVYHYSVSIPSYCLMHIIEIRKRNAISSGLM